MNNQRRKELEAIAEKIAELESDLQQLLDDEQSYYDNMPESIQSGYKGEVVQEGINALEYAVSNLQDAAENIGEAVGI